MKISTGRGIQFFKKPFFVKHRGYVENIYKAGREHIDRAYRSLTGNKK